MMQTNKDIALLLWQGLEQVRLHTAFIDELKKACSASLTTEQPLNVKSLANRLGQLEIECDQVLQQTAVPQSITHHSSAPTR